ALSAKHPRSFKAAAVRNPVTDILSELGATDIPDWCYIESMGLSSSFSYSEEAVLEMHRKSPVTFLTEALRSADDPKIFPPVLFFIGTLDRRVPNYQAKEVWYLLKQHGIPTR